ncbi:hypothetical protein CCACVL1_30796 [Corchorus capsularis]|uniref:RNase H type-1 domain-containing protein n=1 Tax=Corchorus capsularis TaxID=210143 RepID=A0A1R3FVE2_COCAP|nr:hypothetical protein CCACVL1_30796 [Corchorus capsularis]
MEHLRRAQTGIGIVVRDDEGYVLGAHSSHIVLALDPKMVEAQAHFKALEFAADPGQSRIEVEGHCLSLINKIKNTEADLSLFGTIVEDAKHTSHRFEYDD